MTVKFTIDNRYTQLSGDVPHDLIDEELSFEIKGYQFTDAYRKTRWDGRKHLYRPVTSTLPTGLCSMAIDLLKREGIPYTFEDVRIRPMEWNLPIDLNGVRLRPYQLSAVYAALKCCRGVLHMATNAGKTEIAAAIIQRLSLPTLFINHTRTLMYQSAKRFEKRLGVSAGFIGDGRWEPRQLTCCVVKTLEKRLYKSETQKLLAEYPVVISDECHRIGANNWYNVLMKSDAFYRFGLSGTPYMRTDGSQLMLRAATGGTVFTVTNKELIDWGYSSTAAIHMFKIRKPGGMWDDAMVYRDSYIRGIIQNAYRNTLIADIAAFPEAFGLQCGKVIVIVKEIHHGHILKSLIDMRETEVDFVYGEQDTDTQMEKWDNFRNGPLPILVSSTVGDEGMDIPDIRVGIHAAGGKSSIKSLQRLGRGLRKEEAIGKLHLDWVDFIDFHNEYLLDHSKQRLEDYEAENAFEIKVGMGR